MVNSRQCNSIGISTTRHSSTPAYSATNCTTNALSHLHKSSLEEYHVGAIEPLAAAAHEATLPTQKLGGEARDSWSPDPITHGQIWGSRVSHLPDPMALLTHWGRDKMAAILPTTFSSQSYYTKPAEFGFKLNWNISQRVQSTICKCQHSFK